MNSAQFENEALKKAFLNFKKTWNSRNSIEVFSSGSTGDPKKLLITKEQMMLSASKTLQFFDLERGLNALVCLSLDTIAGKMMLARGFVGNWKLKIVEPKANPLIDSDEKFDFVALVPLQLERILEETPKKIELIKTMIIGGAPISESLINQLKKRKITVFQTFGMTETISHIALRKIGFNSESFYQTVEGVSVSAKNGHLIIDYPEMFDNPLHTNDLVKIISPSQFEWIGRTDFIINSGGYKLNPEKIEQKLSKNILVPFFLTGIEDRVLGEKLALVVESTKDFTPLKSQLSQLLDKYEIPKVYSRIDTFLRTKSGKVNRHETLKKISSNDWQELI
jgi:O-succinylbenzoic acid--CoA ligase